jgi:hypothetical protein
MFHLIARHINSSLKNQTTTSADFSNSSSVISSGALSPLSNDVFTFQSFVSDITNFDNTKSSPSSFLFNNNSVHLLMSF